MINPVFAQKGLTFSSLKLIEMDSSNRNSMMHGGANSPMFSMLDVNNDSKKDLFVFDRHSRKILVYLYIKKGEYVHSPEFETIFPKVSDWVLLKDYNQDGKPDLWTRNEYYNSVMLFRNVTKIGDKYCKFEHVSDAVRAYNFSNLIDTSNIFCDRNNIPAIEDVDMDGDVDFITLQSTGLGVTLFLNNSTENQLPLDPPSFEMPDECWGDFSESANTNEIFLSRYQFCRRSYYRYKKHGGGSSILLFDRDADGDQDVLLGNAGYSDLIYLKNGKKDFGFKRDTIIDFNFEYPEIPAKADIYAAAYLLNTEDEVLLLVAPAESNDVSNFPNQNGVFQVYRDIDEGQSFDFVIDTLHIFNHLFNKIGAYSSPAMGDINADGLADLLVGHNGNIRQTRGISDRITVYLGLGNHRFKKLSDDLSNVSSDSMEGLSIALGDYNADNRLDLIMGNKEGQLQIWKNSSISNEIIFEKTNWAAGLSIQQEYATPAAADLDKDGLIDLISGSLNGNFYYFRNTGTPSNPSFSLVTDSLGKINFNPMVWSTIYDPNTQTWVDSLVYDQVGNTSIAFLSDSIFGTRFLVSNKEGTIRGFKMDVQAGILDAWIEDTTFNIVHLGNGVFSSGNFGKITVNKDKKTGQTILVSGSARGGVDAFLLNYTVSITPLKEEKPTVQIFPVPASEWVEIKTVPAFQKAILRNMQGAELLNSNESWISVSNFASGCYLLEIHLQNHIIVTQKLIITK
jgi:hypothetical protein